jgi:hypothetical protein
MAGRRRVKPRLPPARSFPCLAGSSDGRWSGNISTLLIGADYTDPGPAAQLALTILGRF